MLHAMLLLLIVLVSHFLFVLRADGLVIHSFPVFFNVLSCMLIFLVLLYVMCGSQEKQLMSSASANRDPNKIPPKK